MYELISVVEGYEATVFEHSLLTVVEAVALSMCGNLFILSPEGDIIWSVNTGY